MISRRLQTCLFLLGLFFIASAIEPRPLPAGQQSQNDQAAPSSEVIKAESQLVLVDVVATDKKGRHLADLEAKDFRVFEDNKEQTISSFTRVSKEDATGPQEPRYVILFFDNSTMNTSDQTQARKAAAEFVSQVASKDRLMAVLDFGGGTRVAQNFTSDGASLKAAVEKVKFGTLAPNEAGQPTQIASMGAPSAIQMRSDFAARSVLMAIRNVCSTLRKTPGRKTMILFSSGFPLTSNRTPELTATIDAANKSNVAIYPVDVRGLQNFPAPGVINPPGQPSQFPGPPGARLHESLFPRERTLLASLRGGLELPGPLAQRPNPGTTTGRPGGGSGTSGGSTGGGGTPTGGGRTSGGPTGGGPRPAPPSAGSTGGRGGANNPGGNRGGFSPTRGNRPFGPNQPQLRNIPGQQIIPPLLESAETNQQVLYALAEGTGGFMIFNTNDFEKGLQKIADDMDDYYVLGYVPPNPAHDGSYHEIKVKVERHGVELRARNGYYDVKIPDMLAGKPEGKLLEAHARSSAPTDYPVAVTAPYFYTSPDVARVNLALQIPSDKIEFDKEKGKFHAEINVLGIAYRPDGSVAARFSDTVKDDLHKKEMKQWLKAPFKYRNTFNIAPGKYDLKVVLSAGGQKFGKVETPLVIGPFDGKKFGLSGVALSHDMHPVSELATQLDTALLEERTPLIFKGMEIIPSPDHHFTRDEKVGLYCEVYEPEPIVNDFPRVGILVDIYDSKSNQRVFTTNTILVNQYVVEGSPVIPVAIWVPLDRLPGAGNYRLQVQSRDSLGHASPERTANFVLK